MSLTTNTCSFNGSCSGLMMLRRVALFVGALFAMELQSQKRFPRCLNASRIWILSHAQGDFQNSKQKLKTLHDSDSDLDFVLVCGDRLAFAIGKSFIELYKVSKR